MEGFVPSLIVQTLGIAVCSNSFYLGNLEKGYNICITQYPVDRNTWDFWIYISSAIFIPSNCHFKYPPHTSSEPSGRFNSMNQHFWLQNTKIYHKDNKECHFFKYSSLQKKSYQLASTNFWRYKIKNII